MQEPAVLPALTPTVLLTPSVPLTINVLLTPAYLHAGACRTPHSAPCPHSKRTPPVCTQTNGTTLTCMLCGSEIADILDASHLLHVE